MDGRECVVVDVVVGEDVERGAKVGACGLFCSCTVYATNLQLNFWDDLLHDDSHDHLLLIELSLVYASHSSMRN